MHNCSKPLNWNVASLEGEKEDEEFLLRKSRNRRCPKHRWRIAVSLWRPASRWPVRPTSRRFDNKSKRNSSIDERFSSRTHRFGQRADRIDHLIFVLTFVHVIISDLVDVRDASFAPVDLLLWFAVSTVLWSNPPLRCRADAPLSRTPAFLRLRPVLLAAAVSTASYQNA